VKEKAPKKEKVVKEKVVKEKVVKEKVVKEKVVKEKVVKEKAAPVDENIPVDEVDVKEKKVRAPTLPAKYSKFIQYSYYLVRALNNKSLETDGEVLIDEDKFFDMAQVFAEIGEQEEFVSNFLDNKGIAKEMRTHIADKKKAAVKAEKDEAKAAVKAEKDEAKAAVKAEKAAAKEAAKEAAKATKDTKGKAKAKTAKKDAPDLVTSLVTLANATDTTNTLDVPAEEEEELDVQIFTHDSKTYLIDDNNTLYDNETHLVIGTWDKENLTIHRT
jgi:hypothetical protein|tara:strand:- start:624 stop:1439 length:816 start_codon:yes stop_codon:yes gene_type:complete